MLVGLAGNAGAGKDTVAGILREAYGFVRVALADPVRDMLYELDPIIGPDLTLRALVDEVGWDAAERHRLHGPEVRRLQQVFATEVGRNMISPTLWTDLGAQHITELRETGQPVVVTDVWFANEAEMVRSLGGWVVRVLRPGAGLCGLAASHASERLELTCDLTLPNDGDLTLLTARTVELAEHLRRLNRSRNASVASPTTSADAPVAG